MQPSDAARRTIRITAGTPLRLASREAIEVGADDRAVTIFVCDPHLLSGERSFGLGPYAAIVGSWHGFAIYEPFMTSRNGRLASVDGGEEILVGVR
jgi:hypothetical protein